jgi:hypothetical protein
LALLQIHCLLDALRSGQQRVDVLASALDIRARKALGRPISCEFQKTPLSEVARRLSELSGVDVVVDWGDLSQGALVLKTPVNLTLHNQPLRTVLELLIRELGQFKGAYAIRYGQIVLGDEEFLPESTESIVVYKVGPLAKKRPLTDTARTIANYVVGQWEQNDGMGGRIIPFGGDVLLMRQSLLPMESADRLISQMLIDAEAHPPAHPYAPPAPSDIETRRYRVQASQVEDLLRTIPRFVEPQSWGQLRDGSMAQIDKIHLPASGGRFSDLGSAIRSRKFEKRPLEDTPFAPFERDLQDAIVYSALAFTDWMDFEDHRREEPEAVIVIHQTRAVHERIEALIEGLPFAARPPGWTSMEHGCGMPSSFAGPKL